MITGDHRLTATAIAREIGLWDEGDEAVTGAELAAMSDAELADRIMRLRVFARTTAEQKLRIVRAFKARGHVVAMTGDGVNDAPALREAHIGVAMGHGGARTVGPGQAADLVLADDNFATIVEAVREGRAIYRNIQKFIFFLLSSNMGLLVAVFVVSFVQRWPPLTPLMILWINLVTSTGLLRRSRWASTRPDQHLLMRRAPARPGGRGPARRSAAIYFGILLRGRGDGRRRRGPLSACSGQDREALQQAHAHAMAFLAARALPRSSTPGAAGAR